ncbi:hypothetical protein [Streptomyces acidicola]|nr:hypothetical protein [Streptomyces acidicola]
MTVRGASVLRVQGSSPAFMGSCPPMRRIKVGYRFLEWVLTGHAGLISDG